MRSDYERGITVAIVLLAAGYLAYTVHAIFAFPPEWRIQFLPDDAFYYLTLARNFVMHGQWTFDTDISLTNGFHPLHAYALVALYSLTHAPADRFVELGMALSCFPVLPVLLAGMLLVIRTARLVPGLVFMLFALAGNTALNTVSVVEWGWVVVLSASYVFAFWHLGGPHRTAALAGVLLCGFLGSLARTDFGLLTAALALATLPAARTPAGRTMAVGAFLGLATASLGVAVGLWHNHLIADQYLQYSAYMKVLWLDTYGPAMRPILDQTLYLFGNDHKMLKILVSIFALVAVVLGSRGFSRSLFRWHEREDARASGSVDTRRATLWFGCVFVIVGYVLFYSLNPAGVQRWYSAGLVVPAFLAVTMPFIGVRTNHIANIGAIVLLVALIGVQIPRSAGFLAGPPWPHNRSLLRAGRYLEQAALPGRVGSWNAGIIGYYEGGRVVNLDGLVNNDIHEYAKHDELPRYIDEHGIRYVIDFENMFVSETRRKRGGYDSPTFLARLDAIKTFDGDHPSGWYGLTLYEIRETEPDHAEADFEPSPEN